MGYQIKTFFFVGIRNRKTYYINPKAIVSKLTSISGASLKRKERKKKCTELDFIARIRKISEQKYGIS